MAKRVKATRSSHEPPAHTSQDTVARRFVSRGVQVEVREERGRVALTLDGVPVEVEVVDGQYFSHLAHMFTGFGSLDVLVDTLLASEGRTWTLHGHVCDERCASHGGHHHDGPGEHAAGGPQHGAGHPHHEPHDHGGAGHGAAPRGGRRRGSGPDGGGATGGRGAAARRGGRR